MICKNYYKILWKVVQPIVLNTTLSLLHVSFTLSSLIMVSRDSVFFTGNYCFFHKVCWSAAKLSKIRDLNFIIVRLQHFLWITEKNENHQLLLSSYDTRLKTLKIILKTDFYNNFRTHILPLFTHQAKLKFYLANFFTTQQLFYACFTRN